MKNIYCNQKNSKWNQRFLVMFILFFFMVFFTACDGDETTKVDALMKNDFDSSAEEDFYDGNELCVYVTGCVKSPGVYMLPYGSRVYQAIDKAGGFTKKAKEDSLNLAMPVTDGQHIFVMSKAEYKNTSNESNLVNINTADRDLLMTLPGIGASKADAIIRYRESNGSFSRIEDIMNVSGIKEAAFSQIELYITV